MEKVELMRPVQMMTGVLCVAMVGNSFAVILAHVFSTCSAMYLVFLVLQGMQCLRELTSRINA